MTDPDPESERASLAPLTPEEALRALLKIRPDDDELADDLQEQDGEKEADDD